jgi:hypothetical protein
VNKKTLTALMGSISKWALIVGSGGVDEGGNNCPLCELHYNHSTCSLCPVRIATNMPCCDNTPYIGWCYHQQEQHNKHIYLHVICPTCKELAQQELDFLKSLLP